MDLFELKLQSADTDRGCKLLSLFHGPLSVDHCVTVRDDGLYLRCGYDRAVIIDCDGCMIVVICFLRELGKLLRTLFRHGKTYDDLVVVHAILLISCVRRLHVRTRKGDGTVSEHLINRLVQHVTGCRIAVVCIPFVILLADEIQGTGTTKLLQDLVGILNAGDLDVDPV